MYIIVVGGGKVGYYLTKTLLNEGHEVLLIERDQRKVEIYTERFGTVMLADPFRRAAGKLTGPHPGSMNPVPRYRVKATDPGPISRQRRIPGGRGPPTGRRR